MPNGTLAAQEQADTASITVETTPIRIWAIPAEVRTVPIKNEPRIIPVRDR